MRKKPIHYMHIMDKVIPLGDFTWENQVIYPRNADYLYEFPKLEKLNQESVDDVTEENRLDKFCEMLIDIINISHEYRGQIYGGFVRDLIYGFRANDIDVQFRSIKHLYNFIDKLRKKWTLHIIKGSAKYSKLDRDLNVIHTVVVMGPYSYKIDLVSKSLNRHPPYPSYFYYDTTPNMYSIVQRYETIDISSFIQQPLRYVWIDYAYDVVHMIDVQLEPLIDIIQQKPMIFYKTEIVDLEQNFWKSRYQKLLDLGFVCVN